MKELNEMYQEYTKLKGELYQDSPFAVLDDNDERMKRYNQLFQFFHPKFRTIEFVSPMPEFKSTWDIETFVMNLHILERRVNAFNTIKTIRQGDYVRHLSGKMDRVTHVWDDSAQTGGCQSSYYLGEGGYVSYSGGLDPGIRLTKLVLTEEIKKGMVWFFSRDHHTAHNGVDFIIDFRVYKVIE